MDVNGCVHVGHSQYLLTLKGALRYKMLHVLCTRRTSPHISKVYACVFRPVKSPLRAFSKLISLKFMVKFINLRQWKKTFIAATCFDRPHVIHLHFITKSLNNRRQLNDNDLRPNSVFTLVQKISSWKLRVY